MLSGLSLSSALGFQRGVLALGDGDGAEVFLPGAEFHHVQAGDHGEPLHRRGQPVRKIVVARVHAAGHRLRVLHDDLPHALAGETIPAAGDQAVFGQAGLDGIRGIRQRRARSRAADMRGGLVGEIADAGG